MPCHLILVFLVAAGCMPAKAGNLSGEPTFDRFQVLDAADSAPQSHGWFRRWHKPYGHPDVLESLRVDSKQDNLLGFPEDELARIKQKLDLGPRNTSVIDETTGPIAIDEPIPQSGFPPFPERLDLPAWDVSDPQLDKTSGPFKFEPHFFKPSLEERKCNADLTEERLPPPLERNTNLYWEQPTDRYRDQPKYYKPPGPTFLRKLPGNQ